jgi:hypothetical protein
MNIKKGPATLNETPEGYEPRHWEYIRVITATYTVIL